MEEFETSSLALKFLQKTLIQNPFYMQVFECFISKKNGFILVINFIYQNKCGFYIF